MSNKESYYFYRYLSLLKLKKVSHKNMLLKNAYQKFRSLQFFLFQNIMEENTELRSCTSLRTMLCQCKVQSACRSLEEIIHVSIYRISSLIGMSTPGPGSQPITINFTVRPTNLEVKVLNFKVHNLTSLGLMVTKLQKRRRRRKKIKKESTFYSLYFFPLLFNLRRFNDVYDE